MMTRHSLIGIRTATSASNARCTNRAIQSIRATSASKFIKTTTEGHMTKLVDLKDANGTSLQSYVDTLVEKADAAGTTIVVLIAREPDVLDVKTNVPLAVLPDALSQLASQMRKNPTRQETYVPAPDSLS